MLPLASMAQKQKQNIPERYIIVTSGGGEDCYYHLVSPEVWEEFLAKLKETPKYSIAEAVEEIMSDLYNENDYEEVFDKDNINAEVLVFHECKDVFEWIQKNEVRIVGGRN